MSTTPRAVPPAPDSAAGQVTLRQLLGDRAFAMYLTGQTTSGAGSALSAIALAFAVLSISRSAGSLGLVMLASRLPGIGLTLAGGVAADRWSRRTIALGADTIRTVLQVATGILLASGHATVLSLAALQVAAGGASAVFDPAAAALAAGIAPHGQIRRASSLLGITTAVAQTGGLALSGVIVAWAGPTAAFLIDGATFAVSSVTLALIPAAPVRPSARQPVGQALREGWKVVGSRGWLKVYTAHVTTLNVLALSPFFVLGPLVADRRLGGATGWSAIALGYVLGNLAAAQLTYHWAPRRPILAALTVSLALAPLLLLLGLGAPLWLIVPAALLAGAETTVYGTLATAAKQSNLPVDTLGRASAITGIGSTLLVPVGMGLAGTLAAALGTNTVLLGGAGVVLIATVAAVMAPASHAQLRLDRDPTR